MTDILPKESCLGSGGSSNPRLTYAEDAEDNDSPLLIVPQFTCRSAFSYARHAWFPMGLLCAPVKRLQSL